MDLINDIQNNQFYIIVENHKCWIDYRIDGNDIFLMYTKVPSELQGKGIGKVLVKKTIKNIKEQKLNIIPLCGYIQHIISKTKN
ncbi:GNAT family N-acetyltransferase [Wenyingzhuangia sp. IMCC45533]